MSDTTSTRSRVDRLRKGGGVLKFTASWCGPCRVIAPFVGQLSNRCGVPVVSVDVDDNEDLREEFEVRAMPTFLFFEKNKEIGRVVGANREELQKKFEEMKEKTNQISLPSVSEASLTTSAWALPTTME